MKKAMIIVTRECHRSCKLCCNDLPNNQHYWEEATPMTSVRDLMWLDAYDEVRLTGGEPLLYEEAVGGMLHYLHQHNPAQELYLYTSKFTAHLRDMTEVLKGVTFSLHDPFCPHVDGRNLAYMEALSYLRPKVSFRLSIDPAIREHVRLTPAAWSQIKVTPMLGVCPPPAGTTIYVWKGVLR